ncbi:MAG: DUF262 domain-containing HNH endonuclease family protein [Prevotella sp.]|nr:DUF262 domain-containing HNH endonuclease family protein [Prevotella sp.]MDE7088813.1 DUF262 domain-containing HNH endonuclease family protein [Prevotella sp.]
MKYTPEEITKKELFYTIPIYQRLFEWNTENIITLLEDLKKEYKHPTGEGDYYIGMLTSTKDNELVDGQQRFTVMMLLGCVLQDYYEEWKKFLTAGNKSRIDFTSRPLDSTYLRSLIEHKGEDSQSFKNLKMKNGYEKIKEFMEDAQMIPPEEQCPFASYIFHHMCFFISNLPEGYSPRDLNKYFERMNTSGKNLEQHEILKVKLLKNLDNDIDRYMLLWNKLADVDTLLIRRRKDENIEYIKRQALTSDIETIFSNNLINGLKEDTHHNDISIGELEMVAEAPKSEHETNKDSRCALSFPYLLLQVLYRKLDKKINCTINEFFKPSNLLTIFEEYLPFSGNDVNKEDIKDFMERLVKARLALDICFIRPTEYGYSLDMNLGEDNSTLKNLLMFQSMLYVSSSNYTNYRWFNWLMDEVDKNGIPDAEGLYGSLKSRIDKEFSLPLYNELLYKRDNRYWFWRLDFHIWQHRKEFFEKDSPEINIAENYIFKRNRSIEHVAPQTPQSNSMMKWDNTKEDETLRDSFGNLVMISQGLNSALSNESYEVKVAHVKSYCNGSKSGSIESLKLLLLHKDYPNGWTREAIKKHGEKMYDLLKDSLIK